MSINYKQYLPYANEQQKEIIKLLSSGNTQLDSAKLLGIGRRTLQTRLQKLREKAASQGFAPDYGLDKPAPPNFHVSTLRVSSDGKYVPAYAKIANKEVDHKEVMENLIDLAKSMKKFKAPKPPKVVDSDLMNLLTITDLHLGMMTWNRESNSDWDLEIAEELVTSVFSDMIQRLPNAKTCVINQLGDFLHTDSLIPVTPASGHVLDCDSRYYKIAETGFRILKNMVDTALQSHEKVVLYCLPGNHDESSSAMLQIALNAYYSEEDRVTVVTDPKVYQHYVFGNNLLCFHHAHKKKVTDLHKVFSSDPFFSADWGKCRYRYLHTGHLHHLSIKEDMGWIATQHPTIAGRSSYESRGGWSSQRAAMGICYHREFGEYSNVFSRPEMFHDTE